MYLSLFISFWNWSNFPFCHKLFNCIETELDYLKLRPTQLNFKWNYQLELSLAILQVLEQFFVAVKIKIILEISVLILGPQMACFSSKLAICLKYGPILVFSTESQNVYFWTKMGHLWSLNYIQDFWNHFHLNSSKKLLPIHAVSSIFDNPFLWGTLYISDKNHCRK